MAPGQGEHIWVRAQVFNVRKQDWINSLFTLVTRFGVSLSWWAAIKPCRKKEGRRKNQQLSWTFCQMKQRLIETGSRSLHLSSLVSSPSAVDCWQAWTATSWLVQAHSKQWCPSVGINVCLTETKIVNASSCCPSKRCVMSHWTPAAAPNMSVLCHPSPPHTHNHTPLQVKNAFPLFLQLKTRVHWGVATFLHQFTSATELPPPLQ